MLSRGASFPVRLALLRGPNPPRPSTARRAPCMTVRNASQVPVDDDAVPPPAKMSKFADTLRVKKLSEHATLPVRGSEGAAGYDLASAYDYGAR